MLWWSSQSAGFEGEEVGLAKTLYCSVVRLVVTEVWEDIDRCGGDLFEVFAYSFTFSSCHCCLQTQNLEKNFAISTLSSLLEVLSVIFLLELECIDSINAYLGLAEVD